MRKSGVYCIENLENGKKYIGQSVDLEKRKHKHFSSLKGNYHPNIHLQSAYNKYGENNFKFRVLLYCEPFELTRYEQFFVDCYIPETLYNICTECVNSSLGTTLSEKARKKISEANSGKNSPMYGKHHSEEAKRKISEAHSEENCYNSKLTKNQVFEILDLYYNKGKTQTNIAKKFPVSNVAISRIVRGKRWKLCYRKFMENNKK